MAKRKTTIKKLAKRATQNSTSNGNAKSTPTRLSVLKTYKMYIGGAFPRTESGRYYKLQNNSNTLIANMCLGSRKDFRNAVVAARKAQGSWASRTAYNRSQILYRIAEMLEERRDQFIATLTDLGYTTKQAEREVDATVDRAVHYAGWADKYQQIFSAVNPVASAHFNFSVLEPMGVVATFAPEKNGLLGLASAIFPAICGGNSVVILASEKEATAAINFAEVLHTSDLPGGVVNILTGNRAELIDHFATHKDVNAFVYYGNNQADKKAIQTQAADNLKRSIFIDEVDLFLNYHESPYRILATTETKTTWHPIASDMTGGGGAY